MMLSSIIEDNKPVTSSNWLNRLRLSKGISITEDDDASLDDFLRRNHHTEVPATSSASDSPKDTQTPSDPELTESPLEDPGSREWYDVLSELFNFGSSSRSRKKLQRKQSNPRHCSVESPKSIPLINKKREFATSSRNLINKKQVAEKEKRRIVREVEELDEEEKGDKDLIGFSRSEVTVIDTSFDIWKCEKLVFRRRNVWRVREKKGKSRTESSLKKKKKIMKKVKKKKKRKCDVDDDGEITRKGKKMKISKSVPGNVSVPLDEVDGDSGSSNADRILLNRLSSKPRKEGSFSKKKRLVAIGH